MDSEALEFGLYHREILNSALRESTAPLARLGLNPALMNVLNAIAGCPGASGALIAETNDTSQQAAARSLAHLISRGLVRRTVGERATFSHHLTPEGEAKLFAGLTIVARQNRDLLSVLSERELDEYLRLTRKLHSVRARRSVEEVARLTWAADTDSESGGRE